MAVLFTMKKLHKPLFLVFFSVFSGCMYSMQVQKIGQNACVDMRILGEDVLCHVFTFLEVLSKEAAYLCGMVLQVKQWRQK